MKRIVQRNHKILYFIGIVAIIMLALEFYERRKVQIEIDEKYNQEVIDNLMAYDEIQKTTLKALQQNHCYTKDIKIGNLGVTTLRLSTGQFIRGYDAFPHVKQKQRIKKFKKPVTYYCALGLYNFQTPYFFPTQNFYVLKEEDGEREQVNIRLSTEREVRPLPYVASTQIEE